MPPLDDHDLLVTINTKVDMVLGQSLDHETRLRGLERKIYTLAGAATVGGSLFGGIMGLLLTHVIP